MDQQRSRAAATPTTTEQVPAPEPAVTGCLYEAGFHATGPHPQGGVAIARSIDDARRLRESPDTPTTRPVRAGGVHSH